MRYAFHVLLFRVMAILKALMASVKPRPQPRLIIFAAEILVLLILYLLMGIAGFVPFRDRPLTFVCIMIFCVIGLYLLYSTGL